MATEKTLTLGGHLKTLRLKKKWTQSQVAQAVSVSTQAYSRWELDERQPSYADLANVLFALGDPLFMIQNKTIQIGDEFMQRTQNKIPLPSFPELNQEFQWLIDTAITGSLTTLSELKQFAAKHPGILIEVDCKPLTIFSETVEPTHLFFETKHLRVEAECYPGFLCFEHWGILYDDEGHALGDFLLGDEAHYLKTMNRVICENPQRYSLKPNDDLV